MPPAGRPNRSAATQKPSAPAGASQHTSSTFGSQSLDVQQVRAHRRAPVRPTVVGSKQNSGALQSASLVQGLPSLVGTQTPSVHIDPLGHAGKPIAPSAWQWTTASSPVTTTSHLEEKASPMQAASRRMAAPGSRFAKRRACIVVLTLTCIRTFGGRLFSR
jgi:hypothetical protein